jgi:hypothetical protein
MIATLSIAEAARDRRLSPTRCGTTSVRVCSTPCPATEADGAALQLDELQDALGAIDHKISLYRKETA